MLGGGGESKQQPQKKTLKIHLKSREEKKKGFIFIICTYMYFKPKEVALCASFEMPRQLLGLESNRNQDCLSG